ncbi:MAG: phosphatidate cytidylyltransferase [Actinomycetota bacterium]
MRSRIAVAAIGIPLGGLVVWTGGAWFAALAALIAVLGLNELFTLTAEYRPLRWAAHASAVAWVALAWALDDAERGILLGLAVALAAVAVGGLILPRREEVALRLSVTLFGAVYIGFPLAVLVATRQLPDGTGAVVNVLVGTWAFDTFSYMGGRLWGTRRIAPRTSPGKTVEGFVVGLVGGTFAVWVAGLYMDWIAHAESLAVGLAICLSGFVGDLFESLLKRDADVKDSGRLLMGHGGVLDRFDSMLFSSVAAYLVTVFLVY